MVYRLYQFLLFFILISPGFGQLNYLGKIHIKTLHKNLQYNSIIASKFDDIFLLEKNRHEIIKLDMNGKILKQNGGYGWAGNNFDTPVDICINSGLNVFVADYNNHRIVKFDRSLNYLTVFPNSDDSFELPYPLSIATTNLGEIFILEKENNEIYRISTNDSEIFSFGGIEYNEFALKSPVQIKFNKKQGLFVLESNGEILGYDTFGLPILKIKCPEKILAKSFIVRDEGIIVLSELSPKIMFYSFQKKAWKALEILGYTGNRDFVSGTFIKSELLLLRACGVIIKCDFINPFPE